MDIETELKRQTRGNYEFIADYGGWLRAVEKFVLANFKDSDPISGLYVDASYDCGRVWAYVENEDSPERTEFLRRMLHLVGKLDKKFDESAGRFNLIGTKDGITLTLHIGAPATCTITRVEEEVDVPAVEAHKKTVVKYVTSGDCEPLLAPEPPRGGELIPIDAPLAEAIRHDQRQEREGQQ